MDYRTRTRGTGRQVGTRFPYSAMGMTMPTGLQHFIEHQEKLASHATLKRRLQQGDLYVSLYQLRNGLWAVETWRETPKKQGGLVNYIVFKKRILAERWLQTLLKVAKTLQRMEERK